MPEKSSRVEDNIMQKMEESKRQSKQRQLQEKHRQAKQWKLKEKQRLEEQRKMNEQQRQEKERRKEENRRIDEERKILKKRKLEEKQKRHEERLLEEKRRLEEKCRQKEERRLELERKRREKLQEEEERKQRDKLATGSDVTEENVNPVRRQDHHFFKEQNDKRNLKKERPQDTYRLQQIETDRENAKSGYIPLNQRGQKNYGHFEHFPEPRPEKAATLDNDQMADAVLKVGGGLLVLAGLKFSATLRSIATIGTLSYQAYSAYKTITANSPEARSREKQQNKFNYWTWGTSS